MGILTVQILLVLGITLFMVADTVIPGIQSGIKRYLAWLNRHPNPFFYY